MVYRDLETVGWRVGQEMERLRKSLRCLPDGPTLKSPRTFPVEALAVIRAVTVGPVGEGC